MRKPQETVPALRFETFGTRMAGIASPQPSPKGTGETNTDGTDKTDNEKNKLTKILTVGFG